MEQIISPDRTKELLALSGEVKGMGMKTHADFVLKEEGPEGLKKLEKAMHDAGVPVKYEELKRMSFYPLGWEALTLEMMKELFDYDDQKFREVGRFHCKTSWIVKLFMKYFFSLQRMSKEVPKVWQKYFTVGQLKLVDFNEEEKYIRLRVENFTFHPAHCQILAGALSTVLGMMVKGEVEAEEKKCTYKGDDFHEYIVTW